MKRLLFVLLALGTFFACSKPESFVINGEIAGKEDGEVTLLKLADGRWVGEDTARIVDGKFVLNGKVDLPEMRVIRMGQQNVIAQFFAENGEMTVQAWADSLDKTVVTGSDADAEFKVFVDEMKRLSVEAGALQQKFNQARMNRDEEKMKQAQIDFEAMMENQKVYARNFIRGHKSSTVAPFIALWQFSQTMTYEEIDTLVAFFDPEIHSSLYVNELKKLADKQRSTGIGSVAPDFTQNDPEGNPITLSSLRGKILLVDFWASWCQPCRSENPNVVKLYNHYKDKGFDILGVSLDRDKAAWLKAIEDDKLTWHHVSDLNYWKNDVAQQYNVTSIPHTILLDKEGKIIAVNLRGEALAAKLAELLD